MPTLTAEPVVEPDLEPVDGEDEPDHLVCCNSRRTLCGATLATGTGLVTWNGSTDDDLCRMCETVADLPCGAFGCTVRCHLRHWWWSR